MGWEKEHARNGVLFFYETPFGHVFLGVPAGFSFLSIALGPVTQITVSFPLTEGQDAGKSPLAAQHIFSAILRGRRMALTSLKRDVRPHPPSLDNFHHKNPDFKEDV
jgi:hypothetical protein